MNDNLNNVTILPPFKKFCMTIGELPTSYLESMTYYESLVWLCNYLGKTVIPALNANGEAVIELQEKYIELKEYVDNYFDDLNIQKEINNKLDDMAESGELVSIIGAFLDSNAIIGFDTKSALKGAENLVDGSIAKTLGDTTYNDGKGKFYKIRELEEGDVIDDDQLVELTNLSTLVAEKMPDYRMNQVESDIDTINNTTIPNIDSEIDNIESHIEDLTRKKYIFIGDSYCKGWTPDGWVTGWGDALPQKLGLDENDYIVTEAGGTAFSTTAPNKYITLLNALTSDDEVTDVYVFGGYNDWNHTTTNILVGIGEFKLACNNKFPNALIHVGFIGWSKNGETIRQMEHAVRAYEKGCLSNGMEFMNGCEFALHDYFNYFSSDGIHPNQNGATSITNALYHCIKYGSVNIIENSPTSFNLDGTATRWDVIQELNNGTISIFSNQELSPIQLSFNTAKTIEGNALTEIGTLTGNGLIYGTDRPNVSIPVNVVYGQGGSYGRATLDMVFKNGKIYLGYPNATGSGFANITFTSLQIFQFAGSFSALKC